MIINGSEGGGVAGVGEGRGWGWNVGGGGGGREACVPASNSVFESAPNHYRCQRETNMRSHALARPLLFACLTLFSRTDPDGLTGD